MICFYCKEEADTRPYGPGAADVCLPCVQSDPERNRLATAAFSAQVNAALATIGDNGLVIIDSDTGAMNVMTREELLEYGGLGDGS